MLIERQASISAAASGEKFRPAAACLIDVTKVSVCQRPAKRRGIGWLYSNDKGAGEAAIKLHDASSAVRVSKITASMRPLSKVAAFKEMKAETRCEILAR